MQGFDVDGGFGFSGLALFTENLLRASKQFVAPYLDLVAMHIKLLRQFAQGLLPPDRFKGDFRFKSGCVIAPWSSRHSRSPVVGNHAGSQTIKPLIEAVQIPRATSYIKNVMQIDMRYEKSELITNNVTGAFIAKERFARDAFSNKTELGIGVSTGNMNLSAAAFGEFANDRTTFGGRLGASYKFN